MSEIETQKEIAVELLNKLRVIDPDAYLAGGAVRDWYFNKPAKDLDIYIEGQSSSQYQHLILAVQTLLGTEVSRVGREDSEQYASNPNLLRVVQTQYNGIRVQIMQVQDRRKIVSTFPFGICQCGMNWLGQVHYSKAFKQEVKYQSLVLRNPLYKDGDKYLRKIRSYFPDWKYFNNVESFLEFVTEKEV